MKAFLIAPETQSIDAVEIDDRDGVKAVIGFATLASDAVGEAGDRLFFDEACLLCGASGRFQIDSLIAGKAVVIGNAEGGTRLADVATDIDDLRQHIRFPLGTSLSDLGNRRKPSGRARTDRRGFTHAARSNRSARVQTGEEPLEPCAR